MTRNRHSGTRGRADSASGHSRRRLLGLLAAGLGGGLAGCSSSPLEDSTAELDAPESTPVGTPFAIGLPADLVDTVDGVHLAVDDSRGATFEGEITIPEEHDDRRVPVERLREEEQPSYVTRSEAGSETRVTSGLGGDGPIRMVAQHLAPAGSSGPPRFLTGEEPLAADAADGGYEVRIDAVGDGETVASTSTRRILADPDLEERTVPADDLVGRIVRPAGDDPSPGVLVLHGSGATDLSAVSRMLATHGYAVVTLKYFGEADLPETLNDVPLEYFDRAVEWLTSREDVLGDRVGFVGLSRGVEAALSTAAAFDGAATVVGYGGSGIVHPGLTEVYALDRDRPPEEEPGAAGWEAAWTRDGEPVASGEEIREAYGQIGALDLAELEPVGIAVEEIDGPVLLASGDADALWRATVFSEYAVRRRSAHETDHPSSHVVYDDAGHLFLWPYRDYEGVLTADHLGGTPAANARAAADAWVRTLDYLEAGLGSNAEGTT